MESGRGRAVLLLAAPPLCVVAKTRFAEPEAPRGLCHCSKWLDPSSIRHRMFHVEQRDLGLIRGSHGRNAICGLKSGLATLASEQEPL